MKPLIAVAVLGTFAGACAAQSSVTVFGIMDLAVRHVKNGSVGSITSEVSGGTASSRWGLRGSEDLGGGLKASFWLESDIAADTGAGNATSFFNRRSTVSLSSDAAGELRLGRDLIPTHVASCAIDPFGCVGMAAATNYRATQAAVFSGMGGVQVAFRANNGVSYLTPAKLGGFLAQVTVSAGEGQLSAGTEQAKSTALRLGYVSGPINIQAATRKVENATAAISDFKDNVIGASYNFGVATVGLQRRSFEFGADKLAISMAHISVPIGAGVLRATYQRADQKSPNATTNANDSSLIGIGYQHYLSKRTSLYGTATRISNDNRAIFTVAGGPAVTAANFGGQKSTAYEIGLRHDF